MAPCPMPHALYYAVGQSDRPNYIALMRTRDVFACPVRSLGEDWFVRFVLCGEPFPDPLNEEQW